MTCSLYVFLGGLSLFAVDTIGFNLYRKLSLEKSNPLFPEDTIYTKHEIDRLVKQEKFSHKFKPIGKYIEVKVMQRYGSLLNKNNMTMLNEERYKNYTKLISQVGL